MLLPRRWKNRHKCLSTTASRPQIMQQLRRGLAPRNPVKLCSNCEVATGVKTGGNTPDQRHGREYTDRKEERSFLFGGLSLEERGTVL